jgi:hypothetical protein
MTVSNLNGSFTMSREGLADDKSSQITWFPKSKRINTAQNKHILASIDYQPTP